MVINYLLLYLSQHPGSVAKGSPFMEYARDLNPPANFFVKTRAAIITDNIGITQFLKQYRFIIKVCKSFIKQISGFNTHSFQNHIVFD
jgi:hypothetical protein